MCSILTPPYSGFIAISMVHTVHSLNLFDLFYKQHKKTKVMDCIPLEGQEWSRTMPQRTGGELGACSQPYALFTALIFMMFPMFISLHREWVWKQEVWKQKSRIFSSCLPTVSYQIYNFVKHQLFFLILIIWVFSFFLVCLLKICQFSCGSCITFIT